MRHRYGNNNNKFGRLPDPSGMTASNPPLPPSPSSSSGGSGDVLDDPDSYALFQSFERYLRDAVRGTDNDSTVCCPTDEVDVTREGIRFPIYNWNTIDAEFHNLMADFPDAIAEVKNAYTDDGTIQAMVSIVWDYNAQQQQQQPPPQQQQQGYYYPPYRGSGSWWTRFSNQPRHIILAMLGVVGLAAISTSGGQWRSLITMMFPVAGIQ